MKRTEMVRRGTDQLIIAENAIENALSQTAKLVSDLGQLRMNGNISLVVGQDAMSAIVETMSALSNARSSMVKAHSQLDEVKTKLGCRTVATGTMPGKVDDATVLQVFDNDRSAA